jgi:hypothetical protein
VPTFTIWDKQTPIRDYKYEDLEEPTTKKYKLIILQKLENTFEDEYQVLFDSDEEVPF